MKKAKLITSSAVVMTMVMSSIVPAFAYSKEETVYSKLKTNGSEKTTVVSEHLINDQNETSLDDQSSLKNIKNINLYIAGDGPEKINIESYIEKEDLESKVRLLGKLDFDKLKEYIYKSKFVVVPSTWYENGSYIGMEAGAIGRCVIGSNIGGIPEIVVDNKTGLLFEFNSIKDLEKKIKLLLENNELRKKMEVSAKSYIKNEFSSLEHYNKILKIYNKIIEEKKGRK